LVIIIRHLLTVAPGAHLLSDALISSPILSADRSASIPEELGGTGAAPAAGPSSGNDFEFGVDPSLDPELAMVRIIFFHLNK
jgi:26S proteasome regulatory subunit N10